MRRTGRNRGCAQVRANYVRCTRASCLDSSTNMASAFVPYPDRCTQIRAAAELRPPGDPPPSSACEPHLRRVGPRCAVARGRRMEPLTFSTLCFEGTKEGWGPDIVVRLRELDKHHGARAAFANAGFKRYDHGARLPSQTPGSNGISQSRTCCGTRGRSEFLASRKWIWAPPSSSMKGTCPRLARHRPTLQRHSGFTGPRKAPKARTCHF